MVVVGNTRYKNGDSTSGWNLGDTFSSRKGICVDAYSGDWSTTSLMQNDLKENILVTRIDMGATVMSSYANSSWSVADPPENTRSHCVSLQECKNVRWQKGQNLLIHEEAFISFGVYRLKTFYHINYCFAVGCDQGMAMFVKNKK